MYVATNNHVFPLFTEYRHYESIFSPEGVSPGSKGIPSLDDNFDKPLNEKKGAVTSHYSQLHFKETTAINTDEIYEVDNLT